MINPAPLTNKYTLNTEEFSFFQGVVFERTGINLTTAKKDLVESRFSNRLRSLNFGSFVEYKNYLQKLPNNHNEWQLLINEITTNKTDFFREKNHFSYLTDKFLPGWSSFNKGKTLRVWSAACSSGEEAYTLAMILDNFFKDQGKYSILATDIDTKVLDQARNGVYPKNRIADIPSEYTKYFDYGTAEISNWVRVKRFLKDKIEYKMQNLLNFPYQVSDYRMDVIFCRNVFIYFKTETIQEIVEQMYEVARPGALLFIGHSESLLNINTRWKYIAPSVLQKPEDIEIKKKISSEADSKKSSNISIKQHLKKKVLIVDDSSTIRQVLKKIISKSPYLEVVGEAALPSQVEELINNLKPDVLTLDIHMPEMDGVSLLEQLYPKYQIPAVMISSIRKEESNQVLRSLEIGAVDYIEKPSLSEIGTISELIIDKIKAAAGVKARKKNIEKVKRIDSHLLLENSLVAIGSSTGGTEALRRLFSFFPDKIPPVVVVQHIPAVFSRAFASRMNDLNPFDVKEAEDGDLILPNRVLIAPGGKQLKIVQKGAEKRISITDDAPVNRHKPSVDVLFESVATLYGSNAVGVILTGMGGDGAKGLLQMKKAGAKTIAQDEGSSVVFGMPKVAIELGAADFVLDLDLIADKTISLLKTKKGS